MISDEIKNYSNFIVEFNLHIEVPELELNKRTYRYPYDLFTLSLDENNIFRIINDGDKKVDEIIEIIDKINTLSTEDMRKDLIELYSLNEKHKVNIYLADISYSEKIVSIDVDIIE